MVVRYVPALTTVLLLASLMANVPPAAQPAVPPDAMPNQMTDKHYREAIAAGVAYLTKAQSNGNWEDKGPAFGTRFRGGVTALALLALLDAGLHPTKEPVASGLEYLRKLFPEDIYVLALKTVVLSRATPEADRERVLACVELLLAAAKRDRSGALTGFGYDVQGNGPGGNADGRYAGDNSNTNYAIMGLEAADAAGVRLPGQFWENVYNLYVAGQSENGGWRYRNDIRGDERLTMTAAGFSGLLVADRLRCRRQIELGSEGKIWRWRPLEKRGPLHRAAERIAALWSLSPRQGWHYYNLFGIGRAGQHSGSDYFVRYDEKLKPIVAIDWYREAAGQYCTNQNKDGYWGDRSSDVIDHNPIVATSFAVSFLARGQWPLLIQKFAWGAWEDRPLHGGWNAGRHDVCNLTEYCGAKVFSRGGRAVPLRWRIFDSRAHRDDDQALAKLKSAPLLYIGGSGTLRLTDREIELVRAYVDGGGFLLANACDNDAEFDKDFRKLAKALWPKDALAEIRADHPLWTAVKGQAATDNDLQSCYTLEGITLGKRVAVVYTAQDLGLHWTANRLEGKENERIRRAFRLGANLAAYATDGKVE